MNSSRTLAFVVATASGPEEVRVAVLGLVPARFGVLKAAVMATAVFAWSTTRGPASGIVWKGLGLLVLLGGVFFLFRFLPMPLLFAVWAIALTVRSARQTA